MSLTDKIGIRVSIVSKLEEAKLSKILNEPTIKQKIMNTIIEAEAQGGVSEVEITNDKIKVVRKGEHDIIEIDLDEINFND